MLKKLFAPMLFTSILVVAGCSSDEASKDLENAEDVEIDEGDQKEDDTSEDTSEHTKQDTQDSDDQSSDEKDSNDDSSSEQEDQDSTQEQSNDASKEEDQATEQQDSQTGSSGSGGSGQDTNDTSDSSETTQASNEQSFTFNEVNGEAVNVIEGINAVEIKRQNLSGATATSAVAIQAGGKQINLTYNEERDSFRNYEIKDVELEQLKQATVIIQG